MDESNSLLVELGRYVEVLLRQWQLIVSAVLICALTAGLVSVVLPKQYEAEALVATTKVTSSVSFGSSIETLSEEQLLASGAGAYGLVDRGARLESYVQMVANPAVAEAVLAELGEKLDPDYRTPAELLRAVEGGVAPRSDSIAIAVTYPDPLLAAELANAWGRAYVEQVNLVYSTGGTDQSYAAVKEQTQVARREYETARDELIDFYAQSRVDELTRQITETQTIIDSLSEARGLAFQTTIDLQNQAQLQVIEAYLKTQADNQLLALERDQAGRRQLITAYIDALNSGRQAVFNEQVDSLRVQLAEAYAGLRRVQGWLHDAETMRAQVQRGGAGAAASNAVALTLLKAQVFASGASSSGVSSGSSAGSLPADVLTPAAQYQLQLQASPTVVEPAVMIADLDGLVAALEARRESLNQQIDELSQSLLSGEDYQYLDAPLDGEGELAQVVRERYPELFQTGSLAEASLELVEQGNPLSDEVKARATALLELQGLEDVLATDLSGTAINQKINEFQEKVRNTQSELARELDRQNELIRARDLAWDTYSNLATKEKELEVATRTTNTAVALAAPAAVPDRDNVSGVRNVLMAAIAGFLLGVGAAYALEFWWAYKGVEPYPVRVIPFPRRTPSSPAPSSTD